MTRHHSLLACTAIAVMIALGLPSLVAVASANTGDQPPTTTEPPTTTTEPPTTTSEPFNDHDPTANDHDRAANDHDPNRQRPRPNRQPRRPNRQPRQPNRQLRRPNRRRRLEPAAVSAPRIRGPSNRTATTISVVLFRTPDSGMVCRPDYGYEVHAGLGSAWRDVGGFPNAPCDDPDPGLQVQRADPVDDVRAVRSGIPPGRRRKGLLG